MSFSHLLRFVIGITAFVIKFYWNLIICQQLNPFDNSMVDKYLEDWKRFHCWPFFATIRNSGQYFMFTSVWHCIRFIWFDLFWSYNQTMSPDLRVCNFPHKILGTHFSLFTTSTCLHDKVWESIYSLYLKMAFRHVLGFTNQNQAK